MGVLDRFVVATLPLIPKVVVGKVAARYIAGEKLEDAVRTVRELNADGFRATVDVLGEFVTERSETVANVEKYLQVLDAISSEKLNSGVSIKLTSVGLSIDKALVRENLRRVLDEAAARDVFVRIDMEDSPYTSETLSIYEEFRENRHLGIVLQSYLRRTDADVAGLIERGKSDFRICKGIYVEPEEIAFKDRQEIRDSFLRAVDRMLAAGSYVGIATHDEYLVIESEKLIRKHDVPATAYEFQMLLGVRPDLRDEIRRRGHPMRIYVPFGEAWYGYSTRRLKENPQLAGYVFKSMFRVH